MALEHGDPSEDHDLAEVVAHEHRRMADLLDDLATERQDRFGLAHRLIDEMSAHTAAEHQLLYPALRDIVPGGVEMADRAQSDHRAMRLALVALDQSHPGQPEFEEALTSLRADLASHVPMEENELLPALRAVLGSDKLVELGAFYLQLRENIPSGLQGLPADMPEPEFRSW